MIYLVALFKTIHERKTLRYIKHLVDIIHVSDYGVSKHGGYAEAAFARKPQHLGNVSSYGVAELVSNGRKLTANHFMYGNDHSGCRRFYADKLE